MGEVVQQLSGFLEGILFFDILFGSVEGLSIPFLVAWLVVGAVFFTFKMGFVNVSFLGHSIAILRGKYRTKDDKGLITPFQSLTTALSATVGLGNIAGVAVAIMIGGVGATFWMIVAGFFSMTLKFTEVTLSLQYRTFLPDGSVMGGGMRYLAEGLKEKGMGTLGKVLAVVFAVFMMGGALGGGNAFQVSQSLGAVKGEIAFFEAYPWAYGLILAILVGAVIIGGVKSIAKTTEKIVPLMVTIYLSASIYILVVNFALIPDAIMLIVQEAFAPTAVAGGMVGVMVQGFKRAAFSSEAGLGSAPIAHAPAKVKYPVRQGLVALYEPFIDTVLICTMTALVIVTTGVYSGGTSELAGIIEAKQGAALTSAAYATVISWFPSVLALCVTLFAFSTMIAWSYYGERAWTYLFGSKSSMIFKVVFLVIIVCSAMIEDLGDLVNLSDMLMLGMALPNLIGLYLLRNNVSKALEGI
ncbi:MAG: alanine/glycine:cation symporter family protein [Sulfurovum sp.]|nr:alanine/glycine:cation symporter family protein [Sulfurovum sp.]